MFKTLPICVLLGTLGVGCAPPRYTTSAHFFGDVDLARDRQISDRANAVPDSEPSVRVVQGSLPEGLALSDSGDTIVVAPGYGQRYEVLGSVSSEWSKASSAVRSHYWYVDMREDKHGREVFCKAQTPLRVLTLGMWMFVPLQWPCYTGVGKEPDNSEWHLRKMKRAADAMGANLIVISGSTDIHVIDRNTGAVLDTVQGKGLHGYAIVDHGEALTAPTAETIPAPTTHL